MPDSSTSGSRSARLHDRIHILGLAMRFPALADPSDAPYLVSFQYSDIADAETAAESVRTAERYLSEQLGVTFKGRYTKPVGSMKRYQRQAKLASGLWVYITARAEVGPLLEAPRELAAVAA
jgi:hypothetical protein